MDGRFTLTGFFPGLRVFEFDPTTGVTQVVKAVNELKTEVAKLKQALDQIQKAA